MLLNFRQYVCINFFLNVEKMSNVNDYCIIEIKNRKFAHRD